MNKHEKIWQKTCHVGFKKQFTLHIWKNVKFSTSWTLRMDLTSTSHQSFLGLNYRQGKENYVRKRTRTTPFRRENKRGVVDVAWEVAVSSSESVNKVDHVFWESVQLAKESISTSSVLKLVKLNNRWPKRLSNMTLTEIYFHLTSKSCIAFSPWSLRLTRWNCV